jgi:hypothetical protein
MKKKLPVLGIEAHHVGRQHIDGEMRRELRNVFAVTQCKGVLVIAGHEVSTGTFTPNPPVPVYSLPALRRLARAAAFLDHSSSEFIVCLSFLGYC